MKKLPVIKLPRKPVYVKFESDQDFFQVFRKLENHCESCFLLESLGEETYESRFSVLGFEPDYEIKSDGQALIVDGERFEVDNPYYALRDMIPGDILARHYGGGLVGYIGYNAMNYFESSLDLAAHPDFPALEFGLYTDGLILDKLTGEVLYFYYLKDRSEYLQELISRPDPDLSDPVAEFKGASRTEAEHEAMVGEAREEIMAGNTFQCQIGFKFHYEISGSLLPVYQRLRETNPSPHMFYIKFGERKIIGASPELIFRLRQGEMESYPLAGTIRRGKDKEEDRLLAQTLLNDPKEIAEHNMLVDLHRNDIGRVARFGTVKVRRLFDLKRFSHVQHISSEVAGIIASDEDMFSGLASSFPAGTLSGAPKIESMKIINRIEHDPRGPYGGAVGHFGFNGDCTFAIPIRTLFVSGEKAFGQASGGIVYDSNAESEFQEIQNKFAAVGRVMKEFENKGTTK